MSISFIMNAGGDREGHPESEISFIRACFIILILVFIWLHISLLMSTGSPSRYTDINDTDAVIMSIIPSALHNFFSSSSRRSINGSEIAYSHMSNNISDIKRKIAECNAQQVIHNLMNFQSLQQDSIVIVVQIHDRIAYLRHLIVSLAQARGISQTLLVFSHDYYDEAINNLVRKIDFCKVIQIFYPYSIQTYPNEFPGEDPGDCPRSMEKKQAMMKKCNNALHPDSYGHYREANFTQTKHHWWWKANHVFNKLEVTRNHTGLVVLLEEDHYVSRDFIHVLKLMEKTHKHFCEYCYVLSLGTYVTTREYYADYKKVGISSWIGGEHNMGMALNRSTWRRIVKCAVHFCEYDDYNWDWSLQFVSQNCLEQELHVLVAEAPRVFHIGECGVHHRKNNCELASVIYRVHKLLKSAKRHLYPEELILTYPTLPKEVELPKPNGGWGDRRDHLLCNAMTLA